jgi:hypothetical protein
MAACLAAWPAAALLIRPDRDDAEYLELASRYTSSIALGASAGDAVLIAPRWLLASGRQARALGQARALAIGGARHEIQSVHVHPSGALALVLLRTAVAGVEPARIYRDTDERGKTVAIAAPPRASVNTVDRVDARTIATRVKPLDEASDLQGTLTPADLGAAMFIEVKEEPVLAGIAIDPAPEWQTFARVSAYAAWIDDTMFDAGVAEAARR